MLGKIIHPIFLKNQVTKEKRMKVIMEMLAKGEKLHP
jgi:hypothetical protein